MTKLCAKCGHKKTDHKYNNSTWRCWGADDYFEKEFGNGHSTCKCKIWQGFSKPPGCKCEEC